MEIKNIPGWYGKVHVLGDFVSRRLPSHFIEGWDAWLQGALSASKSLLGEKWLSIYLTSPIWRFILSPGVCGDKAWAGILMPSVDKVGRYFPLTLAVQIDDRQALPRAFIGAAEWYERMEKLALSALEDDFDISVFDKKVQEQAFQLSLPIEGVHAFVKQFKDKSSKFSFQIVIDTPKQMTDAFTRLGDCLLLTYSPRYSLWSTIGSEDRNPSLMVYGDLPPRNAFAEFLGGDKITDAGVVETMSLNAENPTATTEAKPHDTLKGSHFRWQSSARTTVGKKRKINEDAFLERPEIGLWVVADGMGGHSAGDLASKAVVDILNTLTGSGNLETLTAGVVECLHTVNAELVRKARALGPDNIIGSTVVAMLAAGRRCAVIWVGDSRLYCYRDDRLSLLTQDHNLRTELSHQGMINFDDFDRTSSENIVTRALGGAPELQIDSINFEAKEEDVFLLCSDGLLKEVHPQKIAAILGREKDYISSQQLIDAALERGARDNVTVIVVHAGQTD